MKSAIRRVDGDAAFDPAHAEPSATTQAVRAARTQSDGARDDLTRIVSGLVYLRTKLCGEVERAGDERTQTWAYLIAAVADYEDEVATRLLERIDEVDHSLDSALAGCRESQKKLVRRAHGWRPCRTRRRTTV
jgi:hypothetical protein